MIDARSRILEGLKGHHDDSVPEPKLPIRQFAWNLAERVNRFQQTLEAVHGEVYRVSDDWPAVLAQRLTQSGARYLRFGPQGPLAEELKAGWPADGPALIPHHQTIEACRDDLFGATDAGFTSCRGGIAETGSLVLWPTPAEPRLLSLVPPIHCMLVEATRIVSTLHALMVNENWGQAMPTNVVLISGPSKSADIEQTLAYGVHGPARLIVLVREGQAV